jgi:peptidoglycan/LPS O-acetylase OafA/YrhL
MAARSGRIDALDGLRALAISAVILTHVLPNRLPGGQVGVDVFFGLSGYLITGLLLREYDRFGRISLRSFYTRRTLRLVPALWVMVIGATIMAVSLHDPHAWGDAAAALTYTSNFLFATIAPRGSYTGHTWSLSIEEQFYLLWPALLIALLAWRPSRLFAATATIGIGLLALNAILQAVGVSDTTLYYVPTTRLPELLAGALGAILMRRGLPRPIARLTSLTAVGLLALAAIVRWMFHDTWDDPWSYRGGFTAVALLTVVVVLHVEQRPGSIVTRLLSLRPVTLVGRRSYAAYLWSIPALIGARELVSDRREVLAVTVAFTAVAATLSWHLVEAPFLRYKRRYERVHLHDDRVNLGDSGAIDEGTVSDQRELSPAVAP